MPHTDTSSRGPAAAALLILLLACIGLAACGGSSSGTSSSANVASTGTSSSSTQSSTGTTSTGTTSTGTTSTGAPAGGSSTTPRTAGRGSARFAALRECLQKNGITLPQRKPGSGRPSSGAGFPAGGGPALPSGVTRAQYEAALKKCGVGAPGGRFGRRGVAPVNNPVFRQALSKYAECLRQNGVNVPAPDTSGKGPVFDTKGINTTSPQFRAATTKCRSTLVGAFRRLPRTGGAGAAGGAASGGGSTG